MVHGGGSDEGCGKEVVENEKKKKERGIERKENLTEWKRKRLVNW